MTEMMRQYGLVRLREDRPGGRSCGPDTRPTSPAWSTRQRVTRSGRSRRRGCRRSGRDHANLRAALEFTLGEPGDPVLGLHLAVVGLVLLGCVRPAPRRTSDGWTARSSAPATRLSIGARRSGPAPSSAYSRAITTTPSSGPTRPCSLAESSATAAARRRRCTCVGWLRCSPAIWRWPGAVSTKASERLCRRTHDSGLAVLLLVHRGLVALFDDRLGRGDDAGG